MKSTLLFLTFIFYLNFLSRVIVGPLLPGLEQDMGLTHAQSSSLFMLLSTGYFIAIVGSGFVSARIGHRNTISLSAILIACGLFFTSFASTLGQLQVGLLGMGMAAGLYLPSAIAVISSEFHKDAWGRAFSVHELAPNLAFVSAPFVVALLLESYPWQLMFRTQALLLGTAGFLFFIFSRGRRERGTAPDLVSLGKVFRARGIFMLIFMFSMGILGTLGVFNLLPLFLVNVHNMSEASANALTGFSRIATVAAAIAGGWMADRLGPFRTMGLVLVTSGLLVIGMAFSSGLVLKACIFLQPVMAVCFFPAAFAGLSSLVKEELRNLVISVVVPLAYVAGGGGIPWFIGFMADMHRFRLGVAIAGILMVASSVLSLRVNAVSSRG